MVVAARPCLFVQAGAGWTGVTRGKGDCTEAHGFGREIRPDDGTVTARAEGRIFRRMPARTAPCAILDRRFRHARRPRPDPRGCQVVRRRDRRPFTAVGIRASGGPSAGHRPVCASSPARRPEIDPAPSRSSQRRPNCGGPFRRRFRVRPAHDRPRRAAVRVRQRSRSAAFNDPPATSRVRDAPRPGSTGVGPPNNPFLFRPASAGWAQPDLDDARDSHLPRFRCRTPGTERP